MFSYCNFCEGGQDNWKVNPDEINYFVTDRWGGSSSDPYSELNMSMNVGDCVDDVLYNRLLVARHAGLPLNRFVYASQVHSNHIEVIREEHLKKGTYAIIKSTDGMITADRNIALCIMVADCVPVLLYDPVKKIVGAFHAGWRGLTDNIVPKGLKMMKEHFGVNPHSVKAFIGPSIGQCCYEIKSKVIEAVEKSVPHYNEVIQKMGSKYFLDLKHAVRLQLLDKGVYNQSITSSIHCTSCNKASYYSYRANMETGRFCAAIALRED